MRRKKKKINYEEKMLMPFLNPKNWKIRRNILFAGQFGSDQKNLPFVAPKWDENNLIADKYMRTKTADGNIVVMDYQEEISYFVIVTPETLDRTNTTWENIFEELGKKIFWGKSFKQHFPINEARNKARQALIEKNQGLYLDIINDKKCLFDLPKSEEKIILKIEGYKIEITAYQIYDDDQGLIATEYQNKIIGKYNTYYHHNIFDGGDVISKEGAKASWCEPEKYTKNELDEIEDIGKIINQGIRM